jgi:hypothetical protein
LHSFWSKRTCHNIYFLFMTTVNSVSQPFVLWFSNYFLRKNSRIWIILINLFSFLPHETYKQSITNINHTYSIY